MTEFIDTQDLRIAYLVSGAEEGWPVVLLHGFPYDVHAYDVVAEHLVVAGARVYVPFLRGYGPTRFLRPQTLRSGQQAALGNDLREFIEMLGLKVPIVAGYDWGGRAACVVAALFPNLISGLVSCNSYNIQDIAASSTPARPEQEHRLWYQYYFGSERGRAGLDQNRESLCRLLWQLWSPTWRFEETAYQESAISFENPDFVDVVIHSYRHRYGLVAGDPRVQDLEQRLAVKPPISVPSITLDGSADGVSGGSTAAHAKHFTGAHEHNTIENAGHNLPQERPTEFAQAVVAVRAWSQLRAARL